MEDRLLTVKEVAKKLCVNDVAIYNLIKEGRLKALKLGRVKIRSFTLNKFLEDLEKENSYGKNLQE